MIVDMDISLGQRPIAVIIGEKTDKCESMAAGDLVFYLSKRIPATVCLVKETEMVRTTNLHECDLIILGTFESNKFLSDIMKKNNWDFKSRIQGDEGFLVKVLKEKEDERISVILLSLTSRGVMYAVYDFLEEICGVGFFLDGDSIPKEDQIKIGKDEYIKAPKFKYRGYFTHSYWVSPYVQCSRMWGFEDWKKEIDWMKKKKYNVLNPIHDEGCSLFGDTIFRAFPEIKKDGKALKNFIIPPEERTSLLKKVINYARDCGVFVSFNFMYSQVPDFFKEYRPDLIYHKMNMNSLGICSSQPECEEIMLRYWAEIVRTFGTDEGHIYYICPYQHEQNLCENVANRSVAALQSYKVIKKIDPQANIYYETWCWNWDKKARNEWEEFNRVMPKEVGAIDWDSAFLSPKILSEAYDCFKPRNWMKLHHLTLEGFYPPAFVGGRKPGQVINAYKEAKDSGAEGILAFNIIANSNDLLSNLVADIGWMDNIEEDVVLGKYVKFRFGAACQKEMGESLKCYIDSIDDGLKLVGGGTQLIAESHLRSRLDKGESLEKVKDELAVYEQKLLLAEKAKSIAESCQNKMISAQFYEKYLFEVRFVILRLQGIISFCKSCLSNNNSQKKQYNDICLEKLKGIAKLYSNRKEYHISGLRNIAKEKRIPYTDFYINNYKEIYSDFWKPMVDSFHVIYENFPKYEKHLIDILPK